MLILLRDGFDGIRLRPIENWSSRSVPSTRSSLHAVLLAQRFNRRHSNSATLDTCKSAERFLKWDLVLLCGTLGPSIPFSLVLQLCRSLQESAGVCRRLQRLRIKHKHTAEPGEKISMVLHAKEFHVSPYLSSCAYISVFWPLNKPARCTDVLHQAQLNHQINAGE